jgi:nucleoside-diphosphate-sugar epimerase
MDSSCNRVLVTGVPGRVGGVGSAIVDILRRRDLPVRALVLREDQHTDALRTNGVDVVVGDLTQACEACRISRLRRQQLYHESPVVRGWWLRADVDVCLTCGPLCTAATLTLVQQACSRVIPLFVAL